jgi:hypothetical protein
MNCIPALGRIPIGSVVFAALHAMHGAAVEAETIRFVVAERPGQVVHGDSYILPLSNADDIAHARALLAAEPGTLASIAVAHIAAGADGVNRDWLAPGRPEWSWHVTEFDGFYDFTAEVLDGWPTFVEQDVPGWIANTGGQIGFWSYTVVAELPTPIPEPGAGAMLLALILLPRIARRGRPASRPPCGIAGPRLFNAIPGVA